MLPRTQPKVWPGSRASELLQVGRRRLVNTRTAALAALLIAVLVVVALPGMTRAASTPAHRANTVETVATASETAANDPILVPVALADLLDV